MLSKIGSVIALFLLAVLLLGCSGEPLTTREKGGLLGTAIGAGGGAIIGSAVGHPAAGALIGGGTGLVAGGLIGDSLMGQEHRQARLNSQVRRQHYELVRQRRAIASLRRHRATTPVE